ncbi:hypothetical protein, partial [Methylobacterium nigriterrae]|uniref:hypothetical protein n=1 Tax=Methylobacterium nigriterrae TaxID=3127512 RepID=UPI003013ACEF
MADERTSRDDETTVLGRVTPDWSFGGSSGVLPDRRPVTAAFNGIGHRFIDRDLDDLDHALAITVHRGRRHALTQCSIG